MPLPPEIQSIVDRLNLELAIMETEANEGLSLIRPVLSSFPDNVRLIQLVALLNNGLLFVEISRRRIRAIVERFSAPDITTAEIQEVGEDLGILLGQCLEAKIRGKRILDILKDLE